MIDDVLEFHKKFRLWDGTEDLLNGNSLLAGVRVQHLSEELDEFVGALETADKVQQFDALIDIVYVALGTALALGISPEMWNKGWAAVHKANMAKERAVREADSKRGTTYDVVKPKGWQSPEEELANVLKQVDNL